jgi:hypothetical protein
MVMDRIDLDMPLLRGVLWKNPRGAVIGQLLYGTAGAAFACATSGTATALLMGAALGLVGAYGGAIIEESAGAPGRVFPRLGELRADGAAWSKYHAIRMRAALRRALRAAREQVRELLDGQRPGHGDMAPGAA